LAIADDLLDPAAMKSATTVVSTDWTLAAKAAAETEPNGEPARRGGLEAGNITRGPAQTTTGGLLGFLQSYPNPLTRFASNGGNNHTNPASLAIGASSAGGGGPAVSLSATTSLSGTNTANQKVPGGFGDVDVKTAPGTTPRTYPLSMIAIVALIAFLIGSLLRSLLSPADFIYVVKDLEAAGMESGWREIRRLFEIKHVFGGWDFQIAVVRRQ